MSDKQSLRTVSRLGAASFGLIVFLMYAAITQALESDVRVTDDRWQVELVARQPDIVTPIGIACDSRGRLFVVESHTHKRPDDYDGPETDRIRMLSDSDGDGRLDRWSTFHEGLDWSLNLVIHDDGVYIVRGRSIVRLRDLDGDDRADEVTEIIRLECEENKAHSALVGLDFASDGTMVFGLGKNTGKPFRVIGSDGVAYEGEGEGGSVFRCRADGTQLERIATGLWNPWGIGVDPYGRIFCTENDPDSSPPCQLLHIVPSGDYGFQTRFGRDGRHPLQSRNGQLPGTLKMVCGIGEAPCDVRPYRGGLWIASWVDHAVRDYRLVPDGASFRASRTTVVKGSTDFRPVGLAPAPDGSLYISDWVDRSYPVHGKGRIWRLSLRDPDEKIEPFPAPSKAEQTAEKLRSNPKFEALSSSDPFLRQAAIAGFSERDSLVDLRWGKLGDAKQRLGLLEAERWRGETPSDELLVAALGDSDKSVRIFATRWIAERGLRKHRDAILGLLDLHDIHTREYLIYLSAADWLDRGMVPKGSGIADQLLAEELELGTRPPSVQALILRLLPPDHESLTPERLAGFISGADSTLRLEAVRTLSLQSRADRAASLIKIANSKEYDQAMRLEAIMGLAGAENESHQVLQTLAEDENVALSREATRALRLSGVTPVPKEKKPPAEDIEAWLALMGQAGDPDAGRRLFFSPGGPLCSRCHRLDGRGGTLAPDLTLVGQQQSRQRILTSILQPSNEIDFRYTPLIVVTDEGKVYMGIPAPALGDDGIERFHNSEGELFALASETIESRDSSTTSIMPKGLDKLMTIDDLRDLLALLTASKE